MDWGAQRDRSACVAIGRLPVEGNKPVFAVVMVKRSAVEYPLTDVIDELAACRAHWACLTLERNGLGEPCCQMLARRLRERPGEEGGARPQEWVIIDHSPDRPKPKPPSGWKQHRRPWSARLNPLHANAPQKAATYSALRLLLDAQQLACRPAPRNCSASFRCCRWTSPPAAKRRSKPVQGTTTSRRARPVDGPIPRRKQAMAHDLGRPSDPRRPGPPPNPTAVAAGGERSRRAQA